MIGTLAMLGTQAFIVVAAAEVNTRVAVGQLRAMLGAGVAIAGACALGAMIGLGAPPPAVLGGVLLACSGPIVAVHAAVQQANGNHGWRFNLARGAAPIIGLLALAALMLLVRPGPPALFLALGVGTAIGSVVAVVLAKEAAPANRRVTAAIRRLSRVGAPLVLLGWLILHVDTVLVSVAGTRRDVGLYGVGVAAKAVVLAVGTAVGLRWFARRDAFGSAVSLLRSFAPTAIVAVGAILLAPAAVPLALGEEFAPSVPVVQLLAVGGLLASFDFLLSHVVLLRGPYFLPALLRSTMVLALVVGVLWLGGQPTESALIFCAVMLTSVGGQAALLSRVRGAEREAK